MSDDYFTRLDEQLSALTSQGAHLDRRARWRPVDRAARRTVAALALVVVLAAMLVIEFPGSASGRVKRAAAQTAQTTGTPRMSGAPQTALTALTSSGPAVARTAAGGRLG
jgi:hypothetical protein